MAFVLWPFALGLIDPTIMNGEIRGSEITAYWPI